MNTLVLDTETNGLGFDARPYLLVVADQQGTRSFRFGQIKGQTFCGSVLGANVFFDVRMIVNAGVHLTALKYDDVLVALYVSTGKWLGLKQVYSVVFGGGGEEKEGLLEAMRKRKGYKRASAARCLTDGWKCVSIAERYCKKDVYMTERLSSLDAVKKAMRTKNYRRIMEADELAYKQTMKGILVSSSVDDFIYTLQREASKIELDFSANCGGCSISSPLQLARLFDTNKADKPTLDALSGNGDARAIKVKEFREIDSAIKTLKAIADGARVDGRIHPLISWHCKTGRASTQKPNVQGIAQRRLAGVDCASVLLADNKQSCFSLDFSQIELYLFSLISGDEKLLEACHNGGDIHAVFQAIIYDGLSNDRKETLLKLSARAAGVTIDKRIDFSLPISDIEKSFGGSLIRKATKRAVFATIYGSSIGGLIAQGLDPKIARTVHDAMSKPIRRATAQTCIQREFRSHGWVRTLYGRKIVPEAEHAALNACIQGSAADIAQDFALALEKYLNKKSGRCMFTRHDEFVCSSISPETDLKAALELARVRLTLEGNEVTLHADGKVFGPSWGIK